MRLTGPGSAPRSSGENPNWILRNDSSRGGTVGQGEPVPDFPKFFPVRFFSQREIYAIAESREARAQLLDNLVMERLEELRRAEADIVGRLRELNLRLATRPEIEKRLRELETEELDARKRLERLNALAAPLAQWRATLAAQRELDELQQAAEAAASAVTDVLRTSHVEAVEPVSEEEEVKRFRGRAAEAEAALRDAVRRALSAFEEALAAAGADVAEWTHKYEEREAEYEALARDRREQVAETKNTLAELDDAAAARNDAIAELEDVWREQQQVRQEKAALLEGAVPRTSANTPVVTVSVEAFGDDDAFRDAMETYVRDRRRITDDDWRNLLDSAVRESPEGESPTALFANWISQLRGGARPNGFPWDVRDRRSEVLVEWCTPAACADIELIRVPDKLVVRLFRDDGSLAGDLETGLSVGQKSTAILTLLLVDDDAPAVIDQPEDDLDNEFTYRQLVPLLRHIKERRQIILSTHDPNLPVNGDAELIYALQAIGGRGVRMKIDGVDAVGALDRSAVRLAVEEVMEGSEEAFRRRYEKYGF